VKPSVYKDGDALIAGFFQLYSFVKDDTSSDPNQHEDFTK
jgi:hypothetical protein